MDLLDGFDQQIVMRQTQDHEQQHHEQPHARIGQHRLEMFPAAESYECERSDQIEGGERGPGHVRPIQFPLRAQQPVIGKAVQEYLVVADVANQDGCSARQEPN